MWWTGPPTREGHCEARNSTHVGSEKRTWKILDGRIVGNTNRNHLRIAKFAWTNNFRADARFFTGQVTPWDEVDAVL